MRIIFTQSYTRRSQQRPDDVAGADSLIKSIVKLPERLNLSTVATHESLHVSIVTTRRRHRPTIITTSFDHSDIKTHGRKARIDGNS